MLVGFAGVDTDTLHESLIVRVAVLASSADAVYGNEAGLAIAVQSVFVENLVDSTSVAMGLVAVADLDGSRLAARGGVAAVVAPVVGRDAHCQEQQERQSVLHMGINLRI